MTINQIKNSKWYRDTVYSEEEVRELLAGIPKIIDEEE